MNADTRPSSLRYWLPLTLAVIAIWADAVSTHIAFESNPNAIEGNPLSAWLFEQLGGLWQTAGVMSGLLGLCALVGRRRSASPWAGSTLVMIFWIAAAMRVPVILTNLHVGSMG